MSPGYESEFLRDLRVHTKLEDVAEPGVWVSEVVETDIVRHVVTVEPFAKIRKPYGVLDEDGVML